MKKILFSLSIFSMFFSSINAANETKKYLRNIQLEVKQQLQQQLQQQQLQQLQPQQLQQQQQPQPLQQLRKQELKLQNDSTHLRNNAHNIKIIRDILRLRDNTKYLMQFISDTMPICSHTNNSITTANQYNNQFLLKFPVISYCSTQSSIDFPTLYSLIFSKTYFTFLKEQIENAKKQALASRLYQKLFPQFPTLKQ